MLLKSSSTSFLGSLIPSYLESPNNHTFHQSWKLSSSSNNGSQNLNKSILSSPSVAESIPYQNGFRRVQSEGNLDELANASYNIDEFTVSSQYPKNIYKKPNFSYMETIPSFMPHRLGTAFENGCSDEELEEESDELEIQESDYTFKAESFVFDELRKNSNDNDKLDGKMYASGLGIYGGDFVDIGGYGGSGGGGSDKPVCFNRDGGQNGQSMEEHYKEMLETSPGNPLFLRNYAQFLYQNKGDLRGAEEYYSRAILADPADGEILSQYAGLIWELHRDRERAANYYERAVDVSSEDSHIHAAYAHFLWDVEDEEEDYIPCALPLIHHGATASATA